MHGWGLEQLDNRTQLFSQTIKSDRVKEFSWPCVNNVCLIVYVCRFLNNNKLTKIGPQSFQGASNLDIL